MCKGGAHKVSQIPGGIAAPLIEPGQADKEQLLREARCRVGFGMLGSQDGQEVDEN